MTDKTPKISDNGFSISGNSKHNASNHITFSQDDSKSYGYSSGNQNSNPIA